MDSDLTSFTEAKGEAVEVYSRSDAGISYTLIEPIIVISDLVIIIIAGMFSGIAHDFIAHHFFMSNLVGTAGTFAGLGLITGVIYVLIGYQLQLYQIQELFRERSDYQRILESWMLTLLLMTIVLFVLKLGGSVSRGAVICFSALGGLALVWARHLVKLQLRKGFIGGKVRGQRAVVLGDINELARFGRRDLLARFGIDEVERITLPRQPGDPARITPRTIQQTLTAVQRVIQCTRDTDVDAIIVVIPWANSTQLDLLRNQLRFSPLPVRLLPDRTVSAILANDSIGATRSLLIDIQRAPLCIWGRLAKRTLDIAIAVASLVAFAPLLALTAMAVKLESGGPIIFKQRRTGFNSKEFVIYKFRTMRVLEDGRSITQAEKNDRRVTKVGRLLRQTSIDELPQLFNVIKGNMSLVGPRPHPVALDDKYRQIIANYGFRHHVKPGMSGWAQVNGYRGETASVELMAKRLELDLWYIKNWSIGLDLVILFRTCFELIRHRNAY